MKRAITIWFVTETNRVLLREVFQKCGKKKICQPIEGWLKHGESLEGGLKRIIEEQLGEKLIGQFHLREIDKNSFFTRKGEQAIRHHFLCLVGNQQLSFVSSKEFRFVGKEDISRIKQIGDPNIVPENDIVLFKEPYDIFFKILENLSEDESESHSFLFSSEARNQGSDEVRFLFFEIAIFTRTFYLFAFC